MPTNFFWLERKRSESGFTDAVTGRLQMSHGVDKNTYPQNEF